MAKVQPIQRSFSAGEISPRLRGNTTSSVYSNGLAHCENFEVTPQGSLEMRAGTQFIATTNEINAVLHTYPRDLGSDVVVVIGDENVTLYNRNGLVINGEPDNDGELLTDPLFLQGLSYWETFIDDGEVIPVSGIGVNIIGGPASAGAKQAIGSCNQNFDTIIGNTIEAKASMLINQPAEGLVGDCVVSVALTEPGNPTPIAIFNQVYGPSGDPYPPAGTVVPIVISGPALSVVTNFSIGVITNFDSTNKQGNMTFYGLSAVDLSAAIFLATPAQWPTPTEWIGKFAAIQSCIDTSENRMIFTCFGAPMFELSLVLSTNFWDFIPFTPVPPDFGGIGFISWVDNWPSACTFHQGRLWLAGSPDNRSAIWASETFNYDDFNLVASPVGNSPLEFEVASSGAIQWIEGLKFLLVGTDLGETIGRSSGPVITSSDFDFPREQTWGCTRIQPIEVGSKLMFITSDLSKVRSLFDGGDTMNGYNSIEATFISEHLTRRRIKDIVFAQNPSYQISCLLSDGGIAQATYYEGAQINAWYRMSMSDRIQAVTASNDLAGTSLWTLVARKVDGDIGDTELILEVKNASNFIGYNLDSWVASIIENNQVTGLDHLNSYEVSVVINNQGVLTLHPPRTPVGGVITLEPWAVGGAMVGLPYTATATTLPLEGTSQAGTSQAGKQRYNEIYARLINSAFPLLNGVRAAIRNPSTPMNLSESPQVDGDVFINSVGWDNGVITVEQDLPLPTQISALFGNAKGNTR